MRENVTLVRRDKDEEKVLVSYFVPGAGAAEFEEQVTEDDEGAAAAGGKAAPATPCSSRAMRRYRTLIKDIRDHLKRKLPRLLVPTLFVPLHKMPLNPNGKIDKPALPFPDTAMVAAVGSCSSSGGKNGADAAAALAAATPTERSSRTWVIAIAAQRTNAPSPIPLDESFFDLGVTRS